MTIEKRPLHLDLNQRLHTHLKVLAATRATTMTARRGLAGFAREVRAGAAEWLMRPGPHRAAESESHSRVTPISGSPFFTSMN